MKLFILIPAYNEEGSLGLVIRGIPRAIPGVHEIKILVLDDGSQDATVKVAREAGADYVISHPVNMGLAAAFKRGLDECLGRGADIIVNIDADNQYNPGEIEKLLSPILRHGAGMVIGNRQVKTLEHMKALNKYGNIFGNFIMRLLTGFNILDASSGFRAFSREAAMKMNIFFGHTYTHQAIIEAVYKKIKIVQVPVEFRRRENKNSRLIKNIFTHIRVSLFVILRTLLAYNPLKTFFTLGSIFFFGGVVVGLRFLYYYFFLPSGATGKIQSLVLAAILIVVGVLFVILGFLADLISINRKIAEEILFRFKEREYEKRNG